MRQIKPRKRKLVAITGASSGIGKELVNRVLHDGFHVLSIGRRAPAAALNAKHVTHITADFKKPRYQDAVLSWLADSGSDYDWLGFVHCAGTASMRRLVSMKYSEIQTDISVNLTSALVLSSILAPYLAKRGGRLIYLGSRARRFAFSGGSAYCASKAGLFSLTDCLALEFRELRWPISVTIFEFGTVGTQFAGKPIDSKQLSAFGAASEIFSHLISPQSDYDKRVIEIVPSIQRLICE